MKSAIGEKLTRKDHADVSNQLVSASDARVPPFTYKASPIVRQIRHRPRRRLDESCRR